MLNFWPDIDIKNKPNTKNFTCFDMLNHLYFQKIVTVMHTYLVSI